MARIVKHPEGFFSQEDIDFIESQFKSRGGEVDINYAGDFVRITLSLGCELGLGAGKLFLSLINSKALNIAHTQGDVSLLYQLLVTSGYNIEE